jgi:hypothetical protein
LYKPDVSNSGVMVSLTSADDTQNPDPVQIMLPFTVSADPNVADVPTVNAVADPVIATRHGMVI